MDDGEKRPVSLPIWEKELYEKRSSRSRVIEIDKFTIEFSQ